MVASVDNLVSWSTLSCKCGKIGQTFVQTCPRNGATLDNFKSGPSCPECVASGDNPGCLHKVGKGDNLVTWAYLVQKWWQLWTTSKVVPSCPGSVASEDNPGCLQKVGKGDNLVTCTVDMGGADGSSHYTKKIFRDFGPQRP